MPKMKDQEVKFEKIPITPQDKKEEKELIPKYFSELELNEEDKKRINKEIMKEFECIEKERNEAGLPEKWDALDDQYKGNIEESEDRQFNLHKHTTKVKVDAIAGAETEAFLDADPIFSISPRPEYAKEAGPEVCEKQQDFLDYKFDTTIPIRPELSKVALSAALKGTGILKLTHHIRRVNRKREEVYEGKEGLKEFKKNWPEEVKKYPSYMKRLEEGGKIQLMVDYKDTVYNDPLPKYVDLKNFFVRLSTPGYEGLKVTKLIVELQEYTWWELKQMENSPNGFFDVDKLKYEWDKRKSKANRTDGDLKLIHNYEDKKYIIMECVYYFKEKEEDKDGEEIRGAFWIGKEREIMIGSIYYPYWGIDSYYFPMYIKQEEDGFYQPGVGEDLTDSNIAEDAMLNFVLEGAWAHNIMTPITDSDDVEQQFLSKSWTHGIPLKKRRDESVDFLNKYKQPFDIMGLLNLIQYMGRGGDDVSGVSSLMTGRESDFDPDAPARKTLALLNQSGKNIKKYIINALPTFNAIGNATLQMYYQISKAGRKYRIRPERVVGTNPFNEISRAEMIARTNIQSQAMNFDFDKLNAKRELYAFYQIIRQEPLIARNPQAVYVLLKLIIKAWSTITRNKIDELLPPLEQIKQEQFAMINQAVMQYIQAQVMKARASGQQPEFPLEPLVALASELQAEIATAPSKEVLKEREKNAKA